MTSKYLFEKVKELELPLGQYALCGSAPMAIRGIRECRDVDIVVTENIWNHCRERGWEIKLTPSGKHQCLQKNDIELWKDWAPGQWDIQQMINEAEIIDGLPFVKLETILKWKKLCGREKDLKDIEAIENFLQKK